MRFGPGVATSIAAFLQNPHPSQLLEILQITARRLSESFAALLQGATGTQGVSVIDVRTGSASAVDCSSAFVDFPAANAPMSGQ